VSQMLRDLLINRELFEEIKLKSFQEDSCEKMESFEKRVFVKLKKKRSLKKYKKFGVKKADLKEIIELSDRVSLKLFDGPSDYQIAEEHPEWCSHCGTCCTQSSPIFIHRDEINLLLIFKPSLNEEIIQNKEYTQHYMFKEDLPCKFHDPEINRCKIYNFRPQVCRTYPLVLIGQDRYTLDLLHKCDYSTQLVLEKSIILFDEAIKRQKK